MSFLNPAGDKTTQPLAQPALSSPTNRGEMGRKIEVKLVFWDKNRLIIENKVN